MSDTQVRPRPLRSAPPRSYAWVIPQPTMETAMKTLLLMALGIPLPVILLIWFLT